MAMGATRLVTRCPACRTAFRVVADQLRLRQGLVRCGQCDNVFDARDHLMEVPVTPADGASAAASSAPTPSAPPPSAQTPPAASVAEPSSAPAGGHPATPTSTPDDEAEADQRLPVWSRELEAGYDVPALDAPTVMLFDDADLPKAHPAPAAGGQQGDEDHEAGDTDPAHADPAPTATHDDGQADVDDDEPLATFVPGVIDADADDRAANAHQPEALAEAQDDAQADAGSGSQPPAAVAPPPPARSASGYLRAPDPGREEPEPAVSATAAAVAREQTTRKWVRQDEPAEPPLSSARSAAARFSPNFLRHGHPGSARTAREGSRRWRAIAIRVALVLLVLAALLQGAYLARSELAGRFPALRPLLEAACAPLACEVPPWRDIDALRIESSQLQKQDDQSDEYQLSVALRNHSAATVALPAIELVLTDLQDQLLLRRVLQPGDYLDSTQRALARQGLAANTELPVRVRFRTPDTAANYRVLIYYP